MSVVAASPRSSRALRNCARLSSAFLMPAIEVGPLMPGVTRVEAVAVIVLAAVGIARPEHQHERLVARLEHRQHHLGGDVGEIGLLGDVGDRGARRRGVAGLAVVAARGRRERKIGLGERVLHLVGQRHAGLAAGGIVDHDRMRPGVDASVWSKIRAGPTLPIVAVEKPLARASFRMVSSLR